MKQKILLAYDASGDAELALASLSGCGLGEDVQVRVLSVGDERGFREPEPFLGSFDDPASAEMELAEARSVAAARATTATNALREAHPSWEVHAVAELGEPRRATWAAAERWPADLVVMGARGHRRLCAEPLGSVASHLVHHSARSIRVVRAGPGAGANAGSPCWLVVGFDGSPDAHLAIQRVGRASWPKDTRVVVVAVACGPDEAKMRDASIEPRPRGLVARERLIDAARRASNVAVEDLAATGIVAEALVLHGDPATRLMETAVDRGAQGIFVGACGNTQLDRVRLGRVATEVVEQAACTVEVVRAAEAKTTVFLT